MADARLRYRPEIDGLRAVAVIIVVLFHAGFGVQGGYIGVDVFFVISGFLITSLIWQRLESGEFTILKFCEKRARRIVPAVVVMTLLTLLASWFVLSNGGYEVLAKAAASQVYFGANFFYWQESGYFAGAPETYPLLHTWSLSVEEQFYLLMPLILLAIFKICQLRSRKVVVTTLIALFALSLALSIDGVTRHPTAAFYLLHTRMWELLMGGLLAFTSARWLLHIHRAVREVLAIIALGLILVPAFIYTPETMFPGLAAVPPCLGSALFIWINTRTDDTSTMPTTTARLLATRPVVFIGLISYSLYLYHWPLLSLAYCYEMGPVSLFYRVLLVFASVGLAALSWQFVETPFRKKQWCASPKAMLVVAGVGLVVVLNVSQVIAYAAGFPERNANRKNSFREASFGTEFFTQMSTDSIKEGRIHACGIRDVSIKPTVMVWGDSHAMAALPALDELFKEQGVAGRGITRSSTAPLLEWYQLNKWSPNYETPQYNQAAIDYIEMFEIKHVILIGRWSLYTFKPEKNSGPFDPALIKTIRRLIAMDCKVWFMLDVPRQDDAVALAIKGATDEEIIAVSTLLDPALAFDGIGRDCIEAIQAAGATILNPKPLFIDPTGRFYLARKDGHDLYQDADHLSTQGSKIMLLPFFRDHLKLEK